MKIVPLGSPFLLQNRLYLGEKSVGVVNGLIVIRRKEKDLLVSIAQRIWKRLIKFSPNFIGHIRFDFVPCLKTKATSSRWKGKPVFDFGSLNVVGIYEINTHSPECAAATSALHSAVPLLSQFQPSATKILAKAIRNTFGDERIMMVKGKGLVKDIWGEVFVRDLINEKIINVVSITPEEVIRASSSVLWRWGDVRGKNGYSEYPIWFQEWLYSFKGVVFNTLTKQDIGDKSLLMPTNKSPFWDKLMGQNRLLSTPEDLEWGVRNQNNLVCKPVLGSSGNGIILGRVVKSSIWATMLSERLITGGYGLFEARWLPRVVLPCLGDFALDFNSAFWVRGSSLQYLYSIARIDYWERYWQRGTINVAQGAGFYGTTIEEEET